MDPNGVALTVEQGKDMAKRHEQFLKRAAATSSFRPRKRHRVSTLKMIQMLDNQVDAQCIRARTPSTTEGYFQVVGCWGLLVVWVATFSFRPGQFTRHLKVRVSMSMPGLKHFSHENPYMKRHWSLWPHLSLASDQGSDMLSGIHALLYHGPTKCNITPYYDVSHGVNRDFWLSITDMSLKPFMLLSMIVINLAHGPDESDTRYNQLKETMGSHYQHATPKLSPLFQSLSGAIIREAGPGIPMDDGQSQEDAVWNHLKQEMCYKRRATSATLGDSVVWSLQVLPCARGGTRPSSRCSSHASSSGC